MSLTYWDSSALLLALSDDTLRDRITGDSSITRGHSIAELFSTLTGGRLGFRISPSDAANQILELASDIRFISLDSKTVLKALNTAERCGVRGGRVHDFLHAIAAREAGAKEILTADKNDFKGLVEGITVKAIAVE